MNSIKRHVYFLLALLLATPAIGQNNALPTPLASNESKVSYGIGLQIGEQLARDKFDNQAIDAAALVKGIQDALAKKDPQLPPAEFQKAMTLVHQAALQRYNQRMKPIIDKNKRQGAAFMTKFRKLPGVKTTPRGVLYQVLKKGTGASPKLSDVVRVHYQGKLVDGKTFDATEPNEPAEFPLNQVIPGWTDALQRMKTGGKWRVVIPSELGYGEPGNGGDIGPHAVLVFEVELLGIVPPSSPNR